MSLLSGFTNQRVELTRKGSPDGFGEATYSAPQTIRARKELRQSRVRNAAGEEVLSTTYVLTEVQVALGDKIDGEEIQALESIVDKGGKTLGYECYL